jgi:uncharacterized protein YbjQ (UPF0145 family)
VAQRIIETPQDPWARAATPDREQLMAAAAVRRVDEPTLFSKAGATPGGAPAPAGRGALPAASRPQPRAARHPEPEESEVFGPGNGRQAPLAEARTEDPLHLVVDLRPERDGEGSVPGRESDGDFGLGSRWGAGWHDAAQGWVRTPAGHPVWRPVVATTDVLPQWDIDTYLGVVTAEVAVEARGGDFQQLGTTLAKGRGVGMEGLVEEAIERGAHGVVGVSMAYTPIGGRLLITITGTAVTLRQKQA